ncbi:MAG: hypothetical protein JO127_07925 [Caulobacteraceae bacterium]|nr:hypothetical protein [Caulobacteraceae bacterium]
MVLIVTPLSRLSQLIAERSPSHVITLLSPEEMIETPAGLEPARHLRLGVHDIAGPQEGLTAPSPEMVEQILSFHAAWDARAPMVIHCWAGISRSTASAFAILCHRNPEADERAIALGMRRAAPHAYPNRRIVALADDILGRRGRMVEAVEAMGANNFVVEGEPFELAARY